jgi:hypothetical protein
MNNLPAPSGLNANGKVLALLHLFHQIFPMSWCGQALPCELTVQRQPYPETQ